MHETSVNRGFENLLEIIEQWFLTLLEVLQASSVHSPNPS